MSGTGMGAQMTKFTRIARSLLLAWLALFACPAAAEPPPLDAYGDLPAFEDAAISSGGEHVAIVGTIKGERKVEKETKGETVHRTERFYGAFERSFALPDDVDPKGIHAESKDGVLMVSLPRVAVQKPKPLAITIQ